MDLQLRGRAGRQGDPGESRFFVSLEDDLLVRYGIEALIAGRVVTGRARRSPSTIPVAARARSPGRSASSRGRTSRFGRRCGATRRVVEEQRRAGDGRAARRSCTATRCRTSGQRAARSRARWSTRPARTRCAAPSGWCMLFQIDRAWRDHLALAADLREGIHLVSLGGQDPLTRFTTEIAAAFRSMEDDDRRGRARRAGPGARERRPRSTWRVSASGDRRRPGPTWSTTIRSATRSGGC